VRRSCELTCKNYEGGGLSQKCCQEELCNGSELDTTIEQARIDKCYKCSSVTNSKCRYGASLTQRETQVCGVGTKYCMVNY
jgi:hypothetical protein